MKRKSVTEQSRKTDERERLLEPYRSELLLHCYRLLGSLHDAEDTVQDTMLRAWRHFDSFTDRGPGSLRAWLYTIATNTSLDTLKKKSPRTLPTAASPAWNPHESVAPRSTEALWLEPFPDARLTEAVENPEPAIPGMRASLSPSSLLSNFFHRASVPSCSLRMCWTGGPPRLRSCLISRFRR